MKLKYFAWVQERLNKNEDVLPLNDINITTLLSKLREMGTDYESVFSKPEKICIAINGELVNMTSSDDYKINDKDEVTFFPPISGG